MSTYTFDQGWEKERERLGSAEFLFDRSSTQRLIRELQSTPGGRLRGASFAGLIDQPIEPLA